MSFRPRLGLGWHVSLLFCSIHVMIRGDLIALPFMVHYLFPSIMIHGTLHLQASYTFIVHGSFQRTLTIALALFPFSLLQFPLRAVSIYIDNAPDLHCPACLSATYVRIYFSDFTASMTNIMIDLRRFLENDRSACEEKGSCRRPELKRMAGRF
ncbi:uncharacterized protein SCHCODRAFT_02092301 [Schizophyllum commune H4-8]|uniref:uncharacterized protein n=1 Tax=Schizophyllum commune (strain H4-8 / FGSC 9210) TaxID=578458 RepID=UPI00215F7081|nr:uncharacterized protein SCHCODRAFT_02092301 [Schizophyllum commune H4-8]KAI5887267.1 hypothetical protein SCHCODRAFT_02092301 [Schizophyllum commune H4-8]